MVIVGITLAFLAGSLPLSVWIGRWGLGTDIRQVGDGNPGAANVWRAGGPAWGTLAVIADFLKGALPVALANFVLGWEDWPLVFVTVAPVLGHAFSPFLKFKGGKALAVTFGAWAGLTLWFGPLVLGLAFALWLLILRNDARAVIAGSFTQLAAFLVIGSEWTWLASWAGITAVLFWKQILGISR